MTMPHSHAGLLRLKQLAPHTASRHAEVREYAQWLGIDVGTQQVRACNADP